MNTFFMVLSVFNYLLTQQLPGAHAPEVAKEDKSCLTLLGVQKVAENVKSGSKSPGTIYLCLSWIDPYSDLMLHEVIHILTDSLMGRPIQSSNTLWSHSYSHQPFHGLTHIFTLTSRSPSHSHQQFHGVTHIVSQQVMQEGLLQDLGQSE